MCGDRASVLWGLGGETGITAEVAAADISFTANCAAIRIDGAFRRRYSYQLRLHDNRGNIDHHPQKSVQAGYAISGVAVGIWSTGQRRVRCHGYRHRMEGASGDDTLTNSGIDTVSVTTPNVTAARCSLEGTSEGLAAGQPQWTEMIRCRQPPWV